MTDPDAVPEPAAVAGDAAGPGLAAGIPPAGPAAAPDLVCIRGLRKRYGAFEALSGLDLTVHEGEVYGFLGRNGAGKSTTIRILMGITHATGGELSLFGEPLGRDPVRLRQRIGYVAQEQNFYAWMTPITIGRFVAGFYPTWDDPEYTRLVQALDLPPRRKIGAFSGGMKAKLALALALAHRPTLLVLDEPTAGLDAVARREFLEMVREQAERTRRTTFFSSHLIDEVERAADRVGIVDDGRMRYEGGLRELSERVRMLRGPAEASLDLPPVPADKSRETSREDGPVGRPEAARQTRRPSGPSGSDAADAERMAGFSVLQDRVRRGHREVVLQTEDPGRFANVLDGAPGWTIMRLSLEDIFIEMVSKPAAGAWTPPPAP